MGVYLHSTALHLFPKELWCFMGTVYDMRRTRQTLFCCFSGTHARTKLELAVAMWLWWTLSAVGLRGNMKNFWKSSRHFLAAFSFSDYILLAGLNFNARQLEHRWNPTCGNVQKGSTKKIPFFIWNIYKCTRLTLIQEVILLNCEMSSKRLLIPISRVSY